MTTDSRGSLSEGWTHVRFGDVVERVSETGIPTAEESTLYIGLEHMESGDSQIRSWGSEVAITNPKTKVRAGDVLFARRNTHLRRAAVAPFDTYYSPDGYAFRSCSPSLLQSFVLHVVSADDFMDYSVRHSSGTHSKRVKWTQLQMYEFALPPLEEQRRRVELLNAVDATRDAYVRVIEASLHGRQAQTYEASETDRSSWQEVRLGDLGAWYSGATPRATNASFYGGDIPFVTIADLNDGPVESTQRNLTEAGAEQIGRLAPKDSVLLSMYGTIGKTGLARGAVATNQAIAWLECDASVCLPEFVFAWLGARSDLFDAMGRGATQRNINREMIRNTPILLPPLGAQRQIVNALSSFRSLDRAVIEAKSSLSELRSRVLDGRVGGTSVL